jgi:hypothetical protein
MYKKVLFYSGLSIGSFCTTNFMVKNFINPRISMEWNNNKKQWFIKNSSHAPFNIDSVDVFVSKEKSVKNGVIDFEHKFITAKKLPNKLGYLLENLNNFVVMDSDKKASKAMVIRIKYSQCFGFEYFIFSYKYTKCGFKTMTVNVF